jgi:hypothetical protein
MTLTRSDFILVPLPAARITAAVAPIPDPPQNSQIPEMRLIYTNLCRQVKAIKHEFFRQAFPLHMKTGNILSGTGGAGGII